ncbi:MAG: LarC family nickel insertion protein [Actinobacteria bacterium]|nr:MAG: LarC family nickel insertion protein [Actinomycetota bacterium]
MSERTLYVDVLGGAAGDMLLAALIDAGAPEQQIFELVERVIPTRFRVRTVEVTRAGIRSRALHIEASSEPWRTPRLPRMLDMLDGAGLPEPIRARARAVLERLGEAEARVHGVPIEEVHLHELGDPDTILDVVGVAAALDLLSIGRMAVSSIPLGEPGPAMLELLRGFRVRSAEVSGETVTPTAAAILSALGEPAELPDFELESIGYGAGQPRPRRRPERRSRAHRIEAGRARRDRLARARPRSARGQHRRPDAGARRRCRAGGVRRRRARRLDHADRDEEGPPRSPAVCPLRAGRGIPCAHRLL